MYSNYTLRHINQTFLLCTGAGAAEVHRAEYPESGGTETAARTGAAGKGAEGKMGA